MTNRAAVPQQQRITTSIFEALVPAIVGRGHGLRALCFFFAMQANLLLDVIASCGLPTPRDTPYRIYCRAGAWTPEQIQQLMIHWPTGAYATVIAQRIGRSAGSVRYKAKWLGLPARPRSSLRRDICEAGLLPLMPAAAISSIERDPADTECAAMPATAPNDPGPTTEEAAQRPADAAAPAPVAIQAVETVPASEPGEMAHSRAVETTAETSEPAEIRPAPASVPAAPAKPKRRKIARSREQDKLLGDLWLRGVSSNAISSELGLDDFRLVECRAYVLELPGRHFIRGRLKMSCDLNEPHIEPFRSQKWKFASCMVNGLPMWQRANGPRISKAAKQTKAYQDKVGSVDEAEFPIDD